MINVSGAFATRWEEEWALAERIEGRDHYDRENSPHSAKRIIELFLDRFGPDILAVLPAIRLERP